MNWFVIYYRYYLKKLDIFLIYLLFKQFFLFLGVRWGIDECVLVKIVSGC